MLIASERWGGGLGAFLQVFFLYCRTTLKKSYFVEVLKMTNWEYMIEQYKIECHFLEVLTQALSVPITIITIAMIFFILRKYIINFIKGFSRYSKIALGNLFIAERNKELDEKEEKELEMVKKEILTSVKRKNIEEEEEEEEEDKFNMQNDVLATLLLKNLFNAITAFRVKISIEQATGDPRFKDIICVDNDLFMKSFYDTKDSLHAFYELYEHGKAWKVLVSHNKGKVSDESVKKIALCVSTLQNEILTRIEILFLTTPY